MSRKRVRETLVAKRQLPGALGAERRDDFLEDPGGVLVAVRGFVGIAKLKKYASIFGRDLRRAFQDANCVVALLRLHEPVLLGKKGA
jgi:hypothetical protein